MMGMEGYFLTLEVETLLDSNEIKKSFEEKYKINQCLIPTGNFLKRYIVDDSRFVIDNKAVVNVVVLKNVTKIIFELCFCNYESNLVYIFNVSKWVSSLGSSAELIVLNNRYNFNLLEFWEFKYLVMQSYAEKYKCFNAKYGEIKKDILPQNFYNWIRYKR